MDVTLSPINKSSNQLISFTVMPSQADFIGPTKFIPAEIDYRKDDSPFIIYENHQPVGYLAVAIREFEDLTCPYIQQLFVDQEHQGRGIGREAMQQIILQLKNDPDCHEIRISTSEENKIALGLYESLGFTRDGQINEHMKRVLTGGEVLLRLQLLER